MEIKVSEVMQREDNSLYLKEIEVINYDEVEIFKYTRQCGKINDRCIRN